MPIRDAQLQMAVTDARYMVIASRPLQHELRYGTTDLKLSV